MEISDFSLDAFSLAGRRALVTGGNTGLGQAFTVALARAGADVFVVSLLDDDGGTRRLVEEGGRRYAETRADITQPGVPGEVVDECVGTLGGLDVLVSSAGICLLADVDDFDRSQWDPMVAVNLTAAFEMAHEASRVMVAQGSGKIINIASLFSWLGGRQSPAYAATKAGIAGFTKAYCDELAGRGVQVNAIAPGYFATAITAATRADAEADRRVVEHIPAGRWGDPADLMGATVFLASRASDYVNGHLLVVDGGYLVR
jgi:NAD(P)-dependent dehydrogenase (short-subunit alcohol dehydrogenase family)